MCDAFAREDNLIVKATHLCREIADDQGAR